MQPSTILIVLGGWYPLACSKVLLPFEDGIATGVSFDGQPLKMHIDTRLSGIYLVYKDWYKKTYGQCACEHLQTGCYSCPGKCNPYAEDTYIVTLANGGKLITVLHESTVVVGEYQLNMKIRLIIGYAPSPLLPNWRPVNLLGLAFDDYANPDTLTRHLYKNNIISKYAVSICCDGDVSSFTGYIIFGLWFWLCVFEGPVTTIPMTEPREDSHFESNLFSYGLVSSTGETFVRQAENGGVIFDSGSTPFVIPRYIFQGLLIKILSFAGPGVHLESTNGVWYITDKGQRYFPTLTFNVGDQQRPFVISIPPEKYINGCNGTLCELALRFCDGSQATLGSSFFTTFFSSFDLDSRTITIAEYLK